VIRRLALFGATGDLAGRHLLPALATLWAAGRLPGGFEVVGAGRRAWDDERFRRHAGDWLARHEGGVPAAACDALLDALRYRAVDLSDPESVARVLDIGRGDGGRPAVAAYLALPPRTYATAATTLFEAGLPAGSRVVLESPFGESLEDARELNALLRGLFEDATEETVFRIDHALGMPTVQRLLALRMSGGLLDAVWDAGHVAELEILWEEDLALEGRAGYYDGAGALKDVIQNHMLQVLSVLALEPRDDRTSADLHDRKARLLRSLRLPTGADVAACTRRARYTAGRIGEREVPSYVDEHGVDPGRGTETFAEVVLGLDAERWAGTRVVLRAGKALAARRKEAVVRFRAGDELRIGIDGPRDVKLRVGTAATGADDRAEALVLSGPPPEDRLPPYAHVLLDVLRGGSELSVRWDEAEAAWKALTPVLKAWADDSVPLEEYPAGSAGPPPRG
jgi:glucose-6-phosphate 1-dehydrogenase